mmetsp:Transcript_53838/g.142976  ORF Transcript_53838/g.142976 Transcript_53838/m.142976 type:complete len:164 (+) Transcript_53838:2-493(+)
MAQAAGAEAGRRGLARRARAWGGPWVPPACDSAGLAEMTFASCARWAMCRNAHLSSWSRKLNAGIKLHRGICSSPLLRLAAEGRPLSGWAESRSSVPCGAVRLQVGEALDDASGTDSAQALAVLINGIAELDAAVANSFITEMLDLSVLGISGSCGLSVYKGL